MRGRDRLRLDAMSREGASCGYCAGARAYRFVFFLFFVPPAARVLFIADRVAVFLWFARVRAGDLPA
jgi:hypothetical protein